MTYMRLLGFSFALMVVLCLGPSTIEAAPVIRSGETVALSADQKVPGDFYAAGGTVSVSGSVEGDLYAAGGSLTVNGPVANDAVLVGGAISIHGTVGDDVRIAAGQVTIAEHVTGDLIVFAGTLSVLSTARIDGDVLFYGGTAEISGPVGGSIHTFSESLRIDTSIGGDVTATVQNQLSLSPIAQVDGSIAYKSGEELVRAPGSVVVGNISRSNLTETVRDASAGNLPAFRLLVTLFAALAALLLFAAPVSRAVTAMNVGVLYQGLIGFGVLVLVPLAAGLLLVSVLGVLVGLMVLFGYMLLLLCAWVLSGIYLGSLLARAFTKKPKVSLLWSALGVATLHALMLMPLAGPVVIFVIFLIVLGGLSKTIYLSLRE